MIPLMNSTKHLNKNCDQFFSNFSESEEGTFSYSVYDASNTLITSIDAEKAFDKTEYPCRI